MVAVRTVGLLAVILAWPALAFAQTPTPAELTAARLREAGRLEKQGMTAARVGNYASAVVPLEAVLMIREKELGPDHPDTVRALDGLAMVSLALGQSGEAEALLRRVVAAREKTLGPDHPDVADSLHNLANACAASDDVRRVDQALPLFERAAAIRAKAQGPENPRLAETINRMATVELFLAQRAGGLHVPDVLAGVRPTPPILTHPKLSRDEYLTRAERGFSQALAIREKALGPEHPAVAASLRGLANVQAARGHYKQAEPLMKRALAIAEKSLGPDHPGTANLLDAYASVLANSRRGSDAEVKALKTRARAIRDGEVRRAAASAPPTIAPAR